MFNLRQSFVYGVKPYLSDMRTGYYGAGVA